MSSSTPPPATGGPAHRRTGPTEVERARNAGPSPDVASDMQIEVWSDVVCPWCYIGKRRLETALEKFPHRDQVEVVWRSFQLDPTIPEGQTFPTLPSLATKYGRTVEEMRQMQARVEEMAAAEGLEYHLANGISGNTGLA